MKVLFVSSSIIPFRGAAAFVTESLCNNFSKDEMAVIGEQVLGLGRIKRDGQTPNYYYARTDLSLKGRGKRFFSFFRWLLFPFLLWRMNRIFKKEQCDYVLGTYPDNYYLYAAYLIARWRKVGFSSYFHNTYLENRTEGTFHRRFAERIQPRIMDYSDYIFVMSEGMQGYFQQQYSAHAEKILPLIHTFEEWPQREKPVDFDSAKEQYDLLLIGNFNNSNAEATGRLVDALKGDPRYNIKMFTHVPKALLKMRGIDAEGIDYRGFVKQEDFYKELMDNDICILTHGFTGGYSPIEYATIFPTRTINFLISGLPIFLHSPPHAFLTDFMKKYDCAEVVDQASEEEIRSRMEKLINNPARRKELAANAAKTAEMFYGPNVAGYLQEKLSLTTQQKEMAGSRAKA